MLYTQAEDTGKTKRQREKKKERDAERKERRKEANDKLIAAREEGNEEVIEQMNKRMVRVTREDNQDCIKLLRLMGVPVIEAPCEAEAQCAAIVKSGRAYATVTEDMDALTFGSPVLLRHMTFSESRKAPIVEGRLDRLLEGPVEQALLHSLVNERPVSTDPAAPAGKARGQHRFARTGRADQQQVVPPRRGDLERHLDRRATMLAVIDNEA